VRTSHPRAHYQRILAGDPDEAEEQAERFIAEHSLSAYYGEVALQGLQLAAADANKAVLAPRQIERNPGELTFLPLSKGQGLK
jgi:hypothetical protein